MRIKVCQVIPTLVQGGAEKQMSLLARHLDREKFESHVVVLTHTGPLEKTLIDSGIEVHLVGKRGKLDPTAFLRLTKTLRDIAPDVVHTWLFAANSYGRLAAKRARVPVIIGGERCVDPWKKWWHHAVDRRMAKLSDTIVTNSNGVVEFCNHHGIPASKFTVIPNAVIPANSARLPRQQFFERLGIEPRGTVIGAVGRLWEQKGYKDLIYAGGLLQVVHPDTWIVILGDGPQRDRLLHYRDQVQAHTVVRLVGHRRDAAEIMSAFDVLWNGSLYEGQSNTILEAMSLGIPVVASDIPGNRELVVHDKTGYLFPLGDVETLARQTLVLVQDTEKRAEMGCNARARCEKYFCLEQMVRSHEVLYTRLVQAKQRGVDAATGR